ncbi:hypothetical protein C0Q70_01235 [Pomacea canaliculata]|uniref:Eukaryotic translation initiation factor 4E binding protein 1 n=1 Tax=Pomacea canaliculata TaxID=400727 RepID=A0A2T7PYY1_POMCA|nr:hypothetical protein C0Q70_01235 [Pomacea canaliculata]
MVLNDISQLPTDYSSTPGGTFFSTTPGGTRIVYERAFLMQCRNSPLAKSPPANMLRIPGVTSPVLSELVRENGDAIHIHEERDKDGNINFFERN